MFILLQEDDYVEKNVIEDDDNSLTVEDLHLLCDLFYLPYDHGAQGNQLLNEFHWLKTNAHVVTGCPAEDNLKPEVSFGPAYFPLNQHLVTL